ncbi:MAG TPA: heavy metal translocating P-type ATPase [Povalibacter sp.]|nr:heavy metal translocating P-type ATPase [Povalibacter sp.]
MSAYAGTIATAGAAECCWHCGETLPAGEIIHARIAGQRRSMCCYGCRAAAEWIEQLGLADYYRLRTEPAPKPDAREVGASAWQRPEIFRHVVRDLDADRRETMLLIEGVRCAACVWLIERALGAMPGIVSIQVNASARRARVVWRDAEITLPKILETLSRTGYHASPLDSQALNDVRRRESRDALKRLLVAGFGAMQAMMYAAVLYFGGNEALDPSTHELFRWLGFLAAMPVVFYSARPFFTGAMRSLRARQLGMDVPVALAIALIYAASLIEALRGGGHVYFDSVSMFVFFLLAGRYLEMRARHRAGDLTDALARLTPPFADLRRDDGTIERIGIHELRVGHQVHVSEGGIVPADGALLDEQCRVDEALLSGESAPVTRRRGDMLIAGSVLVEGPAQLRIERVGADTALAGIAALVERAQAERPQLARAGERAASRFVMRVMILTALTAIAWSYFDPSRAFPAALAVLVVSCPCAFALAVPAAITRSLAVLARWGVLVVRPDAIQSLAETTHVVFDKTGTLTQPDLTVSNVETFNGASRESALRMAASLARGSRHPAARAIAAMSAGDHVEQASDVRSQSGLGLTAFVAGRELRLGRIDFALAGRADLHDCEDAVLLADDTGPIAAFWLTEKLQPGARQAVDALGAQGLQVAIASGDSASKVEDVASRLGISQWRARQLPADKLAWLADLRANGACVMAVGDGVNDAPVLAGADVAVAVAGSAELAQASSDIVLVDGRLGSLAPARTLAKQTLAILQQNQRWALFYNLTAVPVAALGFVPPWLAALGMSMSSVCVILNALRIGREEATP